MKTLAQPTAPNQRIELLDTLRGFAIFGILMVNMHLFSNPLTTMLSGPDTSQSPFLFAGDIFIKLFFEGKFYVLFSLLFGYGFWLFINKTVENGSIIPIYCRRVFILLLFGISHIVLLWGGDILFYYAIFGFLMILFRRKTNRGLIKWVVGLILVPVTITGLGWLLVAVASLYPDLHDTLTASFVGSNYFMKMLRDHAMTVYSTGSFSEIVTVRINEWKMLLPGVLVFYPTVLAMFLLGAWAARNSILKDYRDKAPFFRRLLWWGLSVGVPSTAVYAFSWTKLQAGVPGLWSFLNTSMSIVSGVFMCLFYVSSIVLLVRKRKLASFVKYVAPVGRMALTNYLSHSIICTTLFLSYGFGLMGKINVWQGVVLTIAIYSLQIPFSNWWLSKFNYGPFEWLWRSLTYLRFHKFSKP